MCRVNGIVLLNILFKWEYGVWSVISGNSSSLFRSSDGTCACCLVESKFVSVGFDVTLNCRKIILSLWEREQLLDFALLRRERDEPFVKSLHSMFSVFLGLFRGPPKLVVVVELVQTISKFWLGVLVARSVCTTHLMLKACMWKKCCENQAIALRDLLICLPFSAHF